MALSLYSPLAHVPTIPNIALDTHTHTLFHLLLIPTVLGHECFFFALEIVFSYPDQRDLGDRRVPSILKRIWPRGLDRNICTLQAIGTAGVSVQMLQIV